VQVAARFCKRRRVSNPKEGGQRSVLLARRIKAGVSIGIELSMRNTSRAIARRTVRATARRSFSGMFGRGDPGRESWIVRRTSAWFRPFVGYRGWQHPR
jgi:hypothetical protein